MRETRAFACWLGDSELTKENTAAWKQRLIKNGRAPAGINAALSALNGLLTFLGRDDCRVRFLKVQRRIFCDAERELSRHEYEQLVKTATELGRERLALTLETICSTGIRVSELRFITVEAAQRGRTDISMKGKIRPVILPKALCRKLLACYEMTEVKARECQKSACQIV